MKRNNIENSPKRNNNYSYTNNENVKMKNDPRKIKDKIINI